MDHDTRNLIQWGSADGYWEASAKDGFLRRFVEVTNLKLRIRRRSRQHHLRWSTAG